jgi:hypothetical protein
MRGLLQRLPDGTLTATLTDRWGYVHTLTGTRTDAGYEVEVKLVGVPDDLWVPGDEKWFEVVK